jgi:hypothetical protein
VGKIDARDIEARTDHAGDDAGLVGGGTQGRDNLRSTQCIHNSALQPVCLFPELMGLGLQACAARLRPPPVRLTR